MDNRGSPLENIFNIITGLPQGHDKPVKHAVYNALALFLLFVCCAALWALYLILEPFFKPLMWALLVGSVLHPFKHYVAQRLRQWFDTLDESHTPIFIGVFLLPVHLIDDFSELIGSRIQKNWIYILSGFGGILGVNLVYFYTPKFVVAFIGQLWGCSNFTINFLIDGVSILMVTALLIAYSSLMVLVWTPNNKQKFHYGSMGLWLMFSCLIAKQFGGFRIAMFFLMQIVLLGGFISEVFEIQQGFNGSNSFLKSIMCALQGADSPEPKSEHEESPDVPQTENEPKITKEEELRDLKGVEANKNTEKSPYSLDLFEENPQKMPKSATTITNKPVPAGLGKYRRSLSQPFLRGFPMGKNKSSMLQWRRASIKKASAEDLNSGFYIYALLWGCAGVFFWKNFMFVPILFIPFVIFITKKLGHYLGVWSLLNDHLTKAANSGQVWLNQRYDAIIPVPIRGLFKITAKVNQWCKSNVKESIDTVASGVVIFALIIFAVCASIFIILQIYAEAIALVQMTSNVINQTIVHNPELRQLLPPSFESTIDSIMDNAYQYGREGISKAVKNVMKDVDPAKSEKLEGQILELWDRIYQNWMMSSDSGIGPKVTSDAVEMTWNNFVEDLQKSPEMFNVAGFMSFINQNVGTLMSLLDSIWSIVKGNISLLLGSFSTLISILLGGGTAVLNFILNMVIFLTTLFYLLSSSAELYKPVEILTQYSSSGSRFGLTLGDAVNSVFTASFKMSAFYGLWTWFIHNLFGARIVYLPSAVAAILGAAPFLGAYWACIPAVFDLWLAQDKGFYALIFSCVQFLPVSIVDSAIYAEIKGGHPYLTGLAIAGGIFCLGIEGAIIGPLILCGLYVAMDLSTTFFKESPSEEALKHLSRLQLNTQSNTTI